MTHNRSFENNKNANPSNEPIALGHQTSHDTFVVKLDDLIKAGITRQYLSIKNDQGRFESENESNLNPVLADYIRRMLHFNKKNCPNPDELAKDNDKNKNTEQMKLFFLQQLFKFNPNSGSVNSAEIEQHFNVFINAWEQALAGLTYSNLVTNIGFPFKTEAIANVTLDKEGSINLILVNYSIHSSETKIYLPGIVISRFKLILQPGEFFTFVKEEYSNSLLRNLILPNSAKKETIDSFQQLNNLRKKRNRNPNGEIEKNAFTDQLKMAFFEELKGFESVIQKVSENNKAKEDLIKFADLIGHILLSNEKSFPEETYNLLGVMRATLIDPENAQFYVEVIKSKAQIPTPVSNQSPVQYFDKVSYDNLVSNYPDLKVLFDQVFESLHIQVTEVVEPAPISSAHSDHKLIQASDGQVAEVVESTPISSSPSDDKLKQASDDQVTEVVEPAPISSAHSDRKPKQVRFDDKQNKTHTFYKTRPPHQDVNYRSSLETQQARLNSVDPVQDIILKMFRKRAVEVLCTEIDPKPHHFRTPLFDKLKLAVRYVWVRDKSDDSKKASLLNEFMGIPKFTGSQFDGLKLFAYVFTFSFILIPIKNIIFKGLETALIIPEVIANHGFEKATDFLKEKHSGLANIGAGIVTGLTFSLSYLFKFTRVAVRLVTSPDRSSEEAEVIGGKSFAFVSKMASLTAYIGLVGTFLPLALPYLPSVVTTVFVKVATGLGLKTAGLSTMDAAAIGAGELTVGAMIAKEALTADPDLNKVRTNILAIVSRIGASLRLLVSRVITLPYAKQEKKESTAVNYEFSRSTEPQPSSTEGINPLSDIERKEKHLQSIWQDSSYLIRRELSVNTDTAEVKSDVKSTGKTLESRQKPGLKKPFEQKVEHITSKNREKDSSTPSDVTTRRMPYQK